MLRCTIFLILTGVVTLALCVFVAIDRLPLGVPGQWEWGRVTKPTLWVDYLLTLLAVNVYLVGVAWGARVVGFALWPRRAALGSLVVAGFFVQVAMQHVGYGLAKWPFVLFSKSSSGYYTAAKSDVRSASEYLARYDQIHIEYRARFGPLHLATHPPGLVLMHYGAIRLCESSPRLTRVLLETQPRSVREGFDAVAIGAPVAGADQASIWLIALLSQLASAAAVVPIYVLARRGTSPAAAWFAAALWPLVPAVAVFMPKSDVLYPVFAAASVALVLGGRSGAGRIACCLAGGVVLWAGMILSFALVAVAPLVGLAVAFAEWPRDHVIVRRATARLAAFALAFLIAVAVFWLVTDHNLFGTWYRCYRHQASFYAPQEVGATRTYWPWVALNPLEFAVAVGVPLFAAAVVGTAWLVARDAARPADRATDGTADDQGCGRQLAGVVFAWWLTLVALDLTGKNLGEIARLWMFLMPFAAVASAAVFERSKERRWPALALVALQAIQAMVFAAHVQGFFDPASVQL